MESLVKAGAFDSFQSPQGPVPVHEQAVDPCRHQAERGDRADSLFGGDDERPRSPTSVPAGEWDKPTLLGYEREMLGLYVSDHPLFGVEHIIARESDCSLADLMADDAEPRPRGGDRSDAHIVKVGGISPGCSAR